MSKTRSESRPRLGRGLSSLIPVDAFAETNLTASPLDPPQHLAPLAAQSPAAVATQEPPANAVISIPLGQIVPNPHQPRREFDPNSLAELAASLKSNGIIQPVIVRRLGAEQFQLIAGERRWRAAGQAELATIPAIVREVDSFTQAQLALVENIQRQDLNCMERANAYRSLMDQLGLTQSELATRLGEDRSGIANYLRLLELAPGVREMLGDGRLSLGHGKLLAGLSDQAQQQRLAGLVVAQSLSVRNLERIIAQGDAPAPNRAAPVASAHLSDLEQTISRQLGMRVQIRAGSAKGKGRLVVHYASLDQFDELLARMQVKAE